MYFFKGKPRDRMGIVYADWERPDVERKQPFVKRLPAKTAWEITHLFGVCIGNWALVLERVAKPKERT